MENFTSNGVDRVFSLRENEIIHVDRLWIVSVIGYLKNKYKWSKRTSFSFPVALSQSESLLKEDSSKNHSRI
ncbi:MAG: hypothetical protein COX92_01830 [Candidatus Nealsonbacteria bacterium CG_4_10_14_0_2_um_filter_40_15]|uniref:Uncharacterized protein n=1 Tax=Candidatus Nealsonbacteria bacterium CG_4_10_14_0_2_um_filter_40_15 TaxID=1974682 RepID=A0A2M7UUA9_9BACT|nr:MAG: hypothetical protein COX92_01830 [Candidatus Nealsonbacteria bacterium CG_4_10_14_0_2_um_filter_40_15]